MARLVSLALGVIGMMLIWNLVPVWRLFACYFLVHFAGALWEKDRGVREAKNRLQRARLLSSDQPSRGGR
jgi:hypothetical protein